MANKFVLDVKKLTGTKLFVVDVSAMMRTNYVKLSTGSGEDVFNGYSNKFKKRELSWEVDGEIFNTSALYGLLRIFSMYGFDNYYVFCFDTPKSARKAESGDYKAGRVKADQEYFDQVAVARTMLENVGFLTHSVEGFEADDFIVETVNKNKEFFDHVFVVSNDFDMAQNVDDNVYFKNVVKSRGDITKDNFESVLKCPYNSILLYKALVGDKSDNIPGVKGFGPKAFYRFIDDENIYGDLVNIRKGRKEYSIIKDSITLSEDKKKEALNSLRLIVPRVPKNYDEWSPRKRIDRDLFEMYLIKYGMSSIVKKL